MGNINRINPENHQIPFQRITALMIDADQPLRQSPNRLIGYRNYVEIFRGLIPFADYDGDGNFSYLSDFPEIFPSAASQKTGAAVLFTGDTGCGKHTADLTFMSVVYRFVKKRLAAGDFDGEKGKPKPDEIMAFYRFDLSEYDAESERGFAEILTDLMDWIASEVIGVPSKLYYVSLGDLTRVMESKKLSRLLAAKVRSLMADMRSRCILTGIFDGRASKIDDRSKKPFYVLELEAPAAQSRKEYFDYLTQSYPGVRWELSADELVGVTDGFSFSMIKDMAAYLMAAVKTEALQKRIDLNRVRFESLPEEDMITVPKDRIRFFADLVKKARYVRQPAPAAAPVEVVYQPAIEQNAAPRAAETAVTAPAIADASQPSADRADDNRELSAQEIVANVDTEQDFENVLEMFMIPADYQLAVVMNNRIFDLSALRKAQITVEEFLDACRKDGYVSLKNLDNAKLDLVNHLLLYPKKKELLKNEPLTEEECDYTPVIISGRADKDALARVNLDERQLQQLVMRQNLRVEDVFLGVYTRENELIVYQVR